MSKDILVNKGDTLTVIRDISKLVTNISNGGMATWIPEDETFLVTKTIIKDGTYEASREPTKPYGYSQVTVTGVGNKIMGDLGEKSITKNGVYIAKQDKDGPFYGYSKLYVNVPGGDDGSGGGDGGSSSPTITGKDADGDDAIVGTDEDGRIVTSKLPTRISINVYPNNLVYEDGQTIDFTGLRVKAFLPDNTEWGIVDDNELIKPVRVAEFDSSAYDPTKNYTAEYEGMSVNYASSVYWEYIMNSGTPNEYKVTCRTSSSGYIVVIGNDRNASLYTISSDAGIECEGTRITERPDSDPSIRNLNWASENVLTYKVGSETKTFYYRSSNTSYISSSMDYQSGTLPPSGYSLTETAKIVLEGYKKDSSSESQQTIPLQWKRPGDKKVLETSFTIAVHGSDDSGSGAGPAPTPTPSPS